LGSPETTVTGVCVDSRAVEPGCLFIAMKGERVDGHDFLDSAVESGARVLLVDRPVEEIGFIQRSRVADSIAVVRVADPVAALQAIASAHREHLACPVVGITGSTGKTTTKDFLTSVLSTTYRTVSTQGNRNNEIGLPLTILSGGVQTEVLVVEMGMRGLGQISRLCEIARPDLGLITNVGTSHIEILGSREAIAEAKSELVLAIPHDGRVCLNGDDEVSRAMASRSAAPVVFYGLGPDCEVRATDIVLDDDGNASFVLHTRHGQVNVRLGVSGRHNVYNALAAAAVATELGIDLPSLAEGLSTARFSGMRMESFSTASGVTVVNDAYNANPTSMAAAVDTLGAMRIEGRRIAVLGDMAELGSLAQLAHFEIGELVARVGIDVLVTIGEKAARIADGARAEGMPRENITKCSRMDEALDVLEGLVQPGDAVLAKASRLMGLEAIVEGLVNPRVR
jgi:UDP-N-acetylmuramoyl-tripeptide--D-alanyl-D-alanine ligase